MYFVTGQKEWVCFSVVFSLNKNIIQKTPCSVSSGESNRQNDSLQFKNNLEFYTIAEKHRKKRLSFNQNLQTFWNYNQKAIETLGLAHWILYASKCSLLDITTHQDKKDKIELMDGWSLDDNMNNALKTNYTEGGHTNTKALFIKLAFITWKRRMGKFEKIGFSY